MGLLDGTVLTSTLPGVSISQKLNRGGVSHDDRACRERARSCQPADGRLAHTIRTSKISLHCTLGKPLHRFPSLMRSELGRTAELHTLGLRSCSAITRASEDQRTLELSKTAKHG